MSYNYRITYKLWKRSTCLYS